MLLLLLASVPSAYRPPQPPSPPDEVDLLRSRPLPAAEDVAVASTLKYKYEWHEGFIGAGGDVIPPAMATVDEAIARCDVLARCRGITYEGFFRAIFQVVDIWTETAELDEYIQLLRRLINGVASRGEDNALRWRDDADIKHDRFFDVDGGEKAPPPRKRGGEHKAATSIPRSTPRLWIRRWSSVGGVVRVSLLARS